MKEELAMDQSLDRIYLLPDESKSKLLACAEEVSFLKRHRLMQAGRVEKYIYFIRKGVVRAYTEVAEGEITFWFGQEGDAVLSMKSYIENKAGYENIELLEDCVLFQWRIDELKQLFKEDIHIANWGRKLAEKEILRIESRLISREFLSAKERYDDLFIRMPELFRRVPLKYIASYLGITPVSLSRIRKER